MAFPTNSGNMPRASKADLEEISRVVLATPIIDNHAHPLLTPEAMKSKSLHSILTEAHGEALSAVHTSLAHQRGVRQLASALGCDATWESVTRAIKDKRNKQPEEWVRRCLDGIETILIDDGLDDITDSYGVEWHNEFTRGGHCKQIMRIEAVAGDIIDGIGRKWRELSVHQAIHEDAWTSIIDRFDMEIKMAIEDPEVVGFKSVICYRTGLDIPQEVDTATAVKSLADIIQEYLDGRGSKKIQHPGLNDFLVHRTAQLIQESSGQHMKPIQFHTGLGDNDITLTKASPSHLQAFIRTYPTVPIVLLHASYPFTREAGYLAAMYANVYADIGEVFPFVNQEGQERVIRQILELCPWSKILWSTDGHWFPETYLLAVMQMREVLDIVLREYAEKGQISPAAAVRLTRDILFHNSNNLYQLGLEFKELSTASNSLSGITTSSKKTTDLDILRTVTKGKTEPDFVRFTWLDYTATPRTRMIPYNRLERLLEEGKPAHIGITKASLSVLANDWPIEGMSATGEYRLHPDFASLKDGPVEGQLNMYGVFREKDGSNAGLCPRFKLIQTTERAQEQLGLKFFVGFEIEFLLVKREKIVPFIDACSTDPHSWSRSLPFADPEISQLLSRMVKRLTGMGIEVEQLHAESAMGQFELVLGPLPPVEAVDTLLHTRETMVAAAHEAGYRMTLHPKPFEHACGTAAHMHISIAAPHGNEKAVYEPFYAGILRHLRAITAFTLGGPASYDRVQDGFWAGGTYVTWGNQNRETPLRRIHGSHWEIKCMDGLANPYLAASAILLAGTEGYTQQENLVWRDCQADAAHLTESERKGLGITEKLPRSMKEAIEALKADERMVEMMGPELVHRYAAVKKTEEEFLAGMDAGEKKSWIAQRY